MLASRTSHSPLKFVDCYGCLIVEDVVQAVGIAQWVFPWMTDIKRQTVPLMYKDNHMSQLPAGIW